MVNHYNTFNTSIGKVSNEPTLENATAYGGIIPLLDYVDYVLILIIAKGAEASAIIYSVVESCEGGWFKSILLP